MRGGAFAPSPMRGRRRIGLFKKKSSQTFKGRTKGGGLVCLEGMFTRDKRGKAGREVDLAKKIAMKPRRGERVE